MSSMPEADDVDMDQRRFRLIFLALVAGAAALRVAYVLIAKTQDPVVGDQIYYSAQAVTIANGHWFADPFIEGAYAADHAPMTALALSPGSWSDADPFVAQRLLMSLYGVGAVVATGLLARWLLGRRIALWATAIAAVYANFWMNDALMMSETLSTIAVLAVLGAAYRFDLRRDPSSAILLGVSIGVAGLTRAELLLFGPLLAVPLAAFGRRRDSDGPGDRWGRRIGHVAMAGAAAVAVIAPWVIRNQMRFEESTTISTQDGLTVAGSYCEDAFEGPGKGFWILACPLSIEVPEGADQSERSAIYREVGLDYLSENLSDLPDVVAARLGRGLSIWQTEAMTFLNEGEGRERWASRIGLYQYWLLVPLAVFGLWRWPSRQPRWPLSIGVGVSLLMIMVFYGIPRFRIPGEVTIVLGAAVGADIIWTRLRRSLRRAGPPTSSTRESLQKV